MVLLSPNEEGWIWHFLACFAETLKFRHVLPSAVGQQLFLLG